MKFIKACSAFFLLSFLFASCMDNAGDSDNSGSSGNNARALLYEEVANTVWFASNEYRFDFPEDKDKKIVYLNYMPDGINTERWIQLTAEENGITKAKIIYSTNIREIGKTSEVSFYKESDGNVYFECDFLSATGMQIAADNSASFFDYEKVPALKSDYLSNFDGKYKLNNRGWELQIGAKLSISKDVSHYWFANVLATEYDEKTKTYDLLLAHTSQKGAAGSTSPGITGNEPFVTKQGLFWNHCTLTEIPGGYGMLSGLLVGLKVLRKLWMLLWIWMTHLMVLQKQRCTTSLISTLECLFSQKIAVWNIGQWKEESG